MTSFMLQLNGEIEDKTNQPICGGNVSRLQVSN